MPGDKAQAGKIVIGKWPKAKGNLLPEGPVQFYEDSPFWNEVAAAGQRERLSEEAPKKGDATV